MKKYLFYLPLLVSLFFTACSKDDQKDIIEPITPGKYADGFFIINEGWFGHENGSVNFYKYGEDTIRTNVFKKENTGKELGVSTEYGSVFNGKLYIVSKQGPFVVADAGSLKETGRITELPANGRAFCGINATTGLITTADGVYPINLSTFAIGTKINGIAGETGAIWANDKYAFVISQANGIYVINSATLAVVKNYAKGAIGFALSKDGSLWAATENSLIEINPQTLTFKEINVPKAPFASWYAWEPGSLTASTSENAIYFVSGSSSWSPTQIYKYVIGDEASLSKPLVTLPENKVFYGSGLRFDPVKKQLIAYTVQSGWGENYKYNSLYFFNASNGEKVKEINFEGFYFPAVAVFQ
ncbi:DUF5074 domain-containing protein [Solitalea canadensis]|uniref:DUF5074 domain-containing protein n=1 Tax=Solitalea canadensis (strain ATCC 29591 / DSM 3403 / JCM 21819 / LMG 8368 / NBRC 15130 / NCIMB 12057 / USAM 9D) TaxID=929556 RepID=H8KY02_SOLCM|nr:DUF5074 domain-containing protein [Solitalea canadensis]AFD05740.1 hypothetical protein Solca_0615 [Solitalea canadensis DSM 3403]